VSTKSTNGAKSRGPARVTEARKSARSTEPRINARGHRSSRSTSPAAASSSAPVEATSETISASSAAVIEVDVLATESDATDSATTDLDVQIEPNTPIMTDLDEIAPSADLVRVYLNEIGKVSPKRRRRG